LPTSTTPAELIDFVEAVGRFMEPAPGRTLVVEPEYAFAYDFGHRWAACEGLRVRDVDRVVADVDALVTRSGAEVCSWWLTERTTPADLEQELLARGLRLVESDYLHAGMLSTTAPPEAPGIETRRVETLDDHAVARRLGNPDLGDEQLAAEWALGTEPAWLAYVDGRPASVGRAIYTRAGAYLMGGSTAEWARGRGAYRATVRARWDEAVRRGTPALAVGAGPMSRPILERIGFEQVLQFRRLESVRSEPWQESTSSS
jgi:hypothetical protein